MVDPEKAAKVGSTSCCLLDNQLFLQEKEKLEKKAVKAEKEQKAKVAQNKFVSFFTKAKSSPSSSNS